VRLGCREFEVHRASFDDLREASILLPLGLEGSPSSTFSTYSSNSRVPSVIRSSAVWVHVSVPLAGELLVRFIASRNVCRVNATFPRLLDENVVALK